MVHGHVGVRLTCQVALVVTGDVVIAQGGRREFEPRPARREWLTNEADGDRAPRHALDRQFHRGSLVSCF
jgi:hypothetical protein